jgi:hypothetical protein
MSNKNNPEIIELEKLGDEGKLWAIEIFYTVDGEVKKMVYKNQTNPQVMAIRRAIFQVGIIIPVKDQHGAPVGGSWQIISPMDLGNVFLHKQSGYFP